ncbi:unnamed protein product [Parnassius mnemosyne]|uniref:Uncharacterized protein n=1 Tax=Parnassius mnemosyne TaxID=213953 RepID=A0AAV1L8C4_9NEOP
MKNGGKFLTPGKHRHGRPKKQIDDFDLLRVHFEFAVVDRYDVTADGTVDEKSHAYVFELFVAIFLFLGDVNFISCVLEVLGSGELVLIFFASVFIFLKVRSDIPVAAAVLLITLSNNFNSAWYFFSFSNKLISISDGASG